MKQSVSYALLPCACKDIPMLAQAINHIQLMIPANRTDIKTPPLGSATITPLKQVNKEKKRLKANMKASE